MAPPHDSTPPPDRRRSCRLPATLALAALLAATLAAAPLSRAADDPVTLNFTNADIEAVVKAVSEITGKSFIVDPRVKGTVTIVSARPVPRSLVYPTLLSALRMQGIAVIEGDSVVRVVPETEAKLQGGPVARGAVTAGGDRMVTQVIPLRYESAAQLVNVLRPMITPSNTIAAFPGAEVNGSGGLVPIVLPVVCDVVGCIDDGGDDACRLHPAGRRHRPDHHPDRRPGRDHHDHRDQPAPCHDRC